MARFTQVVRGLIMATVAVGMVACGADSVSRFGAKGDGGPSDDGSATGGSSTGGRPTARGGAGTGGRRATGGGVGSGGRAGAGGGGAGGTPITDAAVTCRSSLDCPTPSVCDTTLGRCVQCAQDLDCGTGRKCIASTCRPGCISDRDCTPFGLLCDLTLGVCAACLNDTDCAPSAHCNLGMCTPDICIAGSQRCMSNAIATCSANGSAFGAPVACGARETCVAAGGAVRCQPWACTAGATECQNASRIVCSTDGLTVLSTTDCSLSGLFCVGGACDARKCAPNTYFCNGNQIDLCSADGLSSSLYQSCGTGTYCNIATFTCAAQTCVPGQLACNGNLVTTCNANGSGYVSGGTDCAATARVCLAGVCTFPQICTPNQLACDGNVATTCNGAGTGFTGARQDCSLTAMTCAAGVCTTCPGGNGAVGSVRVQEIHVGTPDYIAVKNTSTQCPANLAGLDLVMLDSDTTFFSLNRVFSSQAIAPGEVVYIFENTAGTGATDINVGVNIGFTGSRGGWVVLCTGSCTATSAANAVDAVAFAGGQQPPVLPSPLTFSPPVTGLSSTNQDTTSIVRAQVTGVAPNFTSADWTLGAPTR